MFLSYVKDEKELFNCNCNRLGVKPKIITSDSFEDYTKDFFQSQKRLGTSWWDSWSFDNTLEDFEDIFKYNDIRYIHILLLMMCI